MSLWSKLPMTQGPHKQVNLSEASSLFIWEMHVRWDISFYLLDELEFFIVLVAQAANWAVPHFNR